MVSCTINKYLPDTNSPWVPQGPLWGLVLPWALSGPPWAHLELSLGLSGLFLGPLCPWALRPWTLGPGAAKINLVPKRSHTAVRKINDCSQKNDDSSHYQTNRGYTGPTAPWSLSFPWTHLGFPPWAPPWASSSAPSLRALPACSVAPVLLFP